MFSSNQQTIRFYFCVHRLKWTFIATVFVAIVWRSLISSYNEEHKRDACSVTLLKNSQLYQRFDEDARWRREQVLRNARTSVIKTKSLSLKIASNGRPIRLISSLKLLTILRMTKVYWNNFIPSAFRHRPIQSVRYTISNWITLHQFTWCSREGFISRKQSRISGRGAHCP